MKVIDWLIDWLIERDAVVNELDQNKEVGFVNFA